jgi:hypothetical protein
MLDRATRLVPSRLRYHFDNYMAWSAFARFVLLLLFGAFALFLGVGMLHVFAPEAAESKDLLEALWWSWGRVMDPGTGMGDAGRGMRAASIVTTLSGLCVFVLLVGTVATTVQDQLQRLRQTGAPVAERGHTLILGFNDRTLKLIDELAEAHAAHKKSCVVILSGQKKDDVIEAILARYGAPKVKTTRIVVREGSSTSPADLLDVAIVNAASVIVLSADGTLDRGDVRVIKTLLTVLRGLPVPLTANLVAELEGSERLDVVRAIEREKSPVVVVARDFLSRLMVQSVRQVGLSSVYARLLSFEGDEFYVVPLPAALVGHTFREAWSWIEEAVVVGYAARGAEEVVLCPSDDVVLREGDRLLVLMAHAAVELRPRPGATPEGRLPERAPVVEVPQRVLVLGHREDLPTIVSEIDRSFPRGSHVTIVSRLPTHECLSRITSVTGELAHVELEAVQGDITLKRTLERFARAPFDAELLVGETVPGLSDELVDARTLMALLLMRSLEQMGVVSTDRLVSEIRDPRTKELAAIAQVGDFIVSDELVSQLLAQVSESRELGAVWADLVSADGHEIYVKPATLYVGDDEVVSFLDVMARARTRGEVAIGWSPDGDKELALNPPKKRTAQRLHEDARIVVLAERDG